MKLLKYLIVALLFASTVLAATRELLVGKWISKDKREVTEFLADGRFVSASGSIGLRGRYELVGENTIRLIFEGPEAPPPMEFKYRVKDGALALENAQKSVVEFTKLKDAAN
jgi:hypothetical protein